MKWSLRIARFAGIDVFVHWTFVLLITWILLTNLGAGRSLDESLWSIWFVLSLFVCVVLHEFGHALTGRRYGVKTKNIVLLPIGGVANMEKMPEKPIQELWVALAGPAVNVVIAAIIGAILFAQGKMQLPADPSGAINTGNFMFNLFVVNLWLVIFNMIPAFPMDGGRVLRALLAMRYDKVKATNIAAKLGQILGIGFIGLGLFYNVWLVFIGIFIFLGAGNEASYESTQALLSRYRVADVLMRQFTTLHVWDRLDKAVALLLNGQEKEFLVEDDNRIVGVLTREDIIRGLQQSNTDITVGRIAKTELVQLSLDMSLKDAFEQMAKAGIAISPVYENEELVGVVNQENIMELLMVQEAMKGSQVSALSTQHSAVGDQNKAADS